MHIYIAQSIKSSDTPYSAGKKQVRFKFLVNIENYNLYLK